MVGNNRGPRILFIAATLAVIGAIPVFAAANGHHGPADFPHELARLAIELGIILFVARLAGLVARRIHLPGLVGEIIAGALIGPYALGSVGVPYFADGLFPLQAEGLAVSLPLFGFLAIAAIVHVFVAGLESNTTLFLKMSITGVITAIGGMIFGFIGGIIVPVFFLDMSLLEPGTLLLGILSISASVGIPARLLAEKHRMDTPEAVTVMGSAMFQSGIAILLLAVVLGSAAAFEGGEQAVFREQAATLAVRAFALWAIVGVVAILGARYLSSFLKSFKSPVVFSMLALALALVLSGAFEAMGLAAVIGAYILGLSLSKTDISYVIQQQLHPLNAFFVPILFVVTGMLFDVRLLADPQFLVLGLSAAFFSSIFKLFGTTTPAFWANFNRRGVLRIGFGLMPREETALVIAAVGLAAGLMDESVFRIGVLMVLFSILVGTPIYSKLTSGKERGTREPVRGAEPMTLPFHFPNAEVTRLVASAVIDAVRAEDFFFFRMHTSPPTYQFRRDRVFFSLRHDETSIEFTSDPEDAGYVRTLMHETLVQIRTTIAGLSEITDPSNVGTLTGIEPETSGLVLSPYLDIRCIIPRLKGKSKKAVITELVDVLANAGRIQDRDTVLEDVLAREQEFSTAMSDGIAFPHARTKGTKEISIAIGLLPTGLSFGSQDKLPTRIVFLIASPQRRAVPHVQALSTLAGKVKDAESRLALQNLETPEEILRFLKFGVKPNRKKAPARAEPYTAYLPPPM
ncbi:MAG: cation:proton antiporter [Spirochaetia bacterium]